MVWLMAYAARYQETYSSEVGGCLISTGCSKIEVEVCAFGVCSCIVFSLALNILTIEMSRVCDLAFRFFPVALGTEG